MNALLGLIRRSLFILPLIALCLFLNPSSAAAEDGDLKVVKSGPATAAAGTDITYDISVTNIATGTTTTPPNVLIDNLPAGTTFVSETHSNDNWNCVTPAVGSGGTITCTNTNSIGDEDVALFSFVVHILPATTGSISNTATVSQAAEDPTPGNNSSTVVTTISEPPPPPPPPLNPHDVLISEFRLSGPGGNSDEYVELYCNRDVNCDLSGASIRNYNLLAPGDPSPGPGDLSATFPQNTVIPARQYLLVGDITANQYSLGGYGTLNVNVHNQSVADYFNDNQGLQVLSAGDDAVVIDSVGFIGGGDDFQFIEGTGLQQATSRPPDQYAYVRKRTAYATNGLPQDTDNNADDFVLVSVTGNAHPGITAPPVLGAPGPQGLTSPLSYSDAQVSFSLVEPNADVHASPNQERTGSDDSGTISFRRSFTNNTLQTFNYLAFRVIEIPTLNSPITLTPNQAELHLVTSGNVAPFTNSMNRVVSIQGTSLEYDSTSCPGCAPQQPNGGGLNSTVNVVEVFLGPGQTIDVQFLLNIYRAGLYRFYVYVEACPFAFREVEAGNGSLESAIRQCTQLTPTSPTQLINFKSSRTATSVSKKPKRSAPVPTKSFNGLGGSPSISPMRILILNRPVTTPNRRKRKLHARRKSSAALRAKAEKRYSEETTQK